MNTSLLLGSRKGIALASAIGILFVLIVPGLVIKKSSQRELDSLRSKRAELSALGSEYAALKTNIDAVERKNRLIHSDGVANTIDGIVSSLGIKQKMKSIKAIGSRETKGSMSEESAEVRMERVTLNEMVNLFSRIEDAPMILSLKRVSMKKSFENPELLDLTMTVSLYNRK